MNPSLVARVPIATFAGEFEVAAYECGSGFVQLAFIRGDIGGGEAVLTRLHSECLTGDALGSLRCDCGVQLRLALRRIAAEGRGVLLYATGHEGRGIGLVNKLLAYQLQDSGLDTLEANVRLALPVDGRDYSDAAAVLHQLGVRSVRLMTNNPMKVRALESAGIGIVEVVPVVTAAHARNRSYLETKRDRLGHVSPTGPALDGEPKQVPEDVGALLGEVRPHPDRPYVVLKYAQTLDGRIATSTGDSKWISSEDERRVSHSLRAACDAVMVGVGTVERDDPQLTVRMVAGSSPIRVVLDSGLRLPPRSRVLEPEASTIVMTTACSDPERRRALTELGVGIRVVGRSPEGVDLAEALQELARSGIRSLLVEGGARVITSLLGSRLVDRMIVAISPRVIGTGTEAVGNLGVLRIGEGLALTNACTHSAGPDVLIAGDLVMPAPVASSAQR